jgi:hypothetical protein
MLEKPMSATIDAFKHYCFFWIIINFADSGCSTFTFSANTEYAARNIGPRSCSTTQQSIGHVSLLAEPSSLERLIASKAIRRSH